ncbi:MAG TPA: aldehyde ferredoxin oxidoreductase N-terminal domain-containing protein, partial [Desulforhopalus sp.]|nr:aldehyde ferredoxin oxidoreductase N-terminal domain-containing protein [Desulforhopalus sp.]
MFSILRVNVASGETRTESSADPEYLLGGRTLSSRLVSREVPPACDPLGRHNNLFFCTGPLSGTVVSSSDRLSIGGKSPL